MNVRIGIRREDKGQWERRAPIIPRDVRRLIEEHNLDVWVQPSEFRVFHEDEYAQAGARVVQDISPCPVILGVKEIPPPAIRPDHTYAIFSHVVKGQPHNMPMLRQLLRQGCSLVDYERVTDAHGRRLIFFGRYAGLAGMIDSLWALGQRLAWEGIPNPFENVLPAWRYADVAAAKAAITDVGSRIAHDGLPAQISPMVVGFAGYGNVFRGADEIMAVLPVRDVAPADLPAAVSAPAARSVIYKVVFREEHTVEPIAPGERFDLQDYYAHPEKYRSRFAGFLPHLTVLVNCIYWGAAPSTPGDAGRPAQPVRGRQDAPAARHR
jgi:saccharopine dehydrogenase (NAD+, L-lysine-forming)